MKPERIPSTSTKNAPGTGQTPNLQTLPHKKKKKKGPGDIYMKVDVLRCHRI